MGCKRMLLATPVAVSLVAVAMAWGTPAAQAAETVAKKDSNLSQGKPAAPSPTAEAVASAHTAVALARYGDANKDPLALIVAARIIKQSGQAEASATKASAASQQAKDKPDADASEALLERARSLAAGRADLLALADDVAKSGARGAGGGAKIIRSVVGSRTVDTWRITFKGGEQAAVAIVGDGDSDLSLSIVDENNNLVCAPTSSSDGAFCRWSPRWTGVFYIRIRNPGATNQYVLRTN